MSQSDNDRPPSRRQVDRSASGVAGAANKPDSGQRNGDTASSSPESGSLNGDAKRGGKSRRRKKRASNPESCPEGKRDGKAEHEDKPDKRSGRPPAPCTDLTGLQSECSNVWFEHGVYEQAESFYQRWLASASNGTAQSNHSVPAQRTNPSSPLPVAPPPSGLACRHGDQLACHHVVQEVWVNKMTFDQAECRFVEESLQPSIPNSLDLPARPNHPITSRTPDEGYQSLAATPATPVVQQSAAEPINGLPCIPVELLRDVWLEKPAYDRAEAAYYQNLYGNNSSKRPSCSSAGRSNKHPQSLVEEEEEEEEEEEVEQVVVVPVEKRVVLQGKAEVFHALHPIQEEEEPAEVPETEEAPAATACYFLHPDSERVWLDKWRYDAAESRFHGGRRGEAVAARDAPCPGVEGSPVSSAAPHRDNTMDVLVHEKIWFDKHRYDEAERRFYERVNNEPSQQQQQQQQQEVGANTILQDIARARENIQKSLAGLKTSLRIRGDRPSSNPRPRLSTNSCTADPGELVCRIQSLELENQSLHKVVDDLRTALSKLECRVAVLEKPPAAAAAAAASPSAPCTNGTAVQQKSSAPVKEEEDEDDFDCFGSDEDLEAEQLKEQRLKEYAERKAKKPALIAKSSILLDVKPWDDETDMAKLEECVRSVQADGLLWGTSKLVPVGYGIKKLQIACVVEDEKVGTDLLEEEITKFEDYVQSVDVAAFNKI